MLSNIDLGKSSWLITVLVIAIFASASFGKEPAKVLVFDENIQKQNLSAYLSTFISSSLSLEPDEVLKAPDTQFSPLDGEPNFGHLMGTLWVSFDLLYQPIDPKLTDIQLYLEIPYAILAHVKLVYRDSSSESWQTIDLGYAFPQDIRPIPFRHTVFPLTFSADKPRQFFMAIQRVNGAVKAPLVLWAPEQFTRYQGASNYFIGGILAALFIMAVYNFFIYMSVRENMYLYYSFYIMSNFLTILTFTGLGFELFWPQSPELNPKLLPFGGFCIILFLGLFIRDFLELRKFTPLLNKIFISIIYLMAAINVMLWLTDFYFGRVINYSIIIGSALVLFTIILRFSQSPRKCLFFSAAFLSFFMGAVLYGLDLANILTSNFVTQNGLMIGALCEVVILSFALADRINIEKQQRIAALEVQRDALIELEQTKQELIYQGTHNSITKVPNKLFFIRKFTSEIVKQTDSSVLFLIHLNGFQEVNKTLGHVNGDNIIKKYTDKLHSYFETLDIISIEKKDNQIYYFAQLNINTFCAVIKNNRSDCHSPGEDSSDVQIKSIIKRLPKSITYQSMQIDLEPVVGYTHYPEDGEHIDDLIQNANIAVEAAQAQSRYLVAYSRKFDNFSEQNLILMSELRTAIVNSELMLYFQPQVSLENQRISGVECLLRWNHPERGFVPPVKFIPYAEQTGIISELTHWVIKEAIHTARYFHEHHYPISFSVNISAKNLKEIDFVESLTQMAIGTMDAGKLVLEITETMVMEDVEESIRTLHQLVDKGFRIAIDDFGTGYSSLSYLRKLPAHELKIDRSFVIELGTNKADYSLVKNIIDMAHSLKLQVVAEGIEDEATYNRLIDLDCDYAQGYHIHKPMPKEELLQLLKDTEHTPVVDSVDPDQDK